MSYVDTELGEVDAISVMNIEELNSLLLHGEQGVQ